MQILVIEDQKKTAGYLKKGLQEQGYIVDCANNGNDGCHLALEHDFDVIILDIMLPEKDGWSILVTLRNRKPSLPILILSACDQVTDRVKGLETGADDYLIKPFAFSELLARINILVTRKRHIPIINEIRIVCRRF